MYVVLTRDIYGDIQVLCICKNIDTAKDMVQKRNEKHANSYCWYQKGAVVDW